MSDNLYNLALDIRERAQYLNELGVESMSVELLEIKAPEKAELNISPSLENTLVSADVNNSIPVLQSEKENRTPGSRLEGLPSLSKRPVPTSQDIPVPSNSIAFQPGLAEATAAIDAIRADIGNCVRCPLHEGRTQIVHSTGNLGARLMFVGEAPGADEDIEGKPFVGRAGKLLTDIIAGMGFRREDVFIGNINRCRPPGNRQPLPIETEACRPFLLREIDVIKPKVIVVLGNTATQNLLGIKTPISKIRGQFQDYFGLKVMPTFHPAYLLRDPHKKREVWEDMKKVRDHINATGE